MPSLCGELAGQLEQNRPVVRAVIMDQEGSAPRTAGARMLVFPDGSLQGTVGGGRYEADAIAAALELFERAGSAAPAETPGLGCLLSFSLRGVTDMDMICGGALTLLLEYVPPTPSMKALFEQALREEKASRPFAFITRMEKVGAQQGAGGDTRQDVRVERTLFCPKQEPGTRLVHDRPTPPHVPDDLQQLALSFDSAAPRHIAMNGEEYLVEPFPGRFRVLIFGGGHVSRELAFLAGGLDFQTSIFEDRPEFASAKRFPNAHCELLPSLEEEDCARALDRYHPDERHAIIIVTRGHAFDRDALAAALGTGAGYIGMIGSKSKRQAVYARLRQQGFSQERLDFVHSPIGLAIGAETPQEIAVSIMAELILWRSTTRKTPQ